MKENAAYIIIGIIIGIGLSIGLYVLYPLLPTFDFTPYYPQLERINYYCEEYTTKNIAEFGIILMIVIPTAIFVIRERNRKI